MTEPLNDPRNVPVNKFQKIIELLQIPADQELAEDQMDLVMAVPSGPGSIKEKIERYNSLLRQNKTLGLSEKFIYIFIAFAYTISYLAGKKIHRTVAIKAAEKAILYARSENDDYHCALFNWYLGLIHCSAGKTEKSTQYLEKAGQLLISIQELYLGIRSKNKHELRSIEVDINSDLETAAHWVQAQADKKDQDEPENKDCTDQEIEQNLLDYIHRYLNRLDGE